MWVGSAFGRFSENRFRERVRLLSLMFAVAYVGLVFRLFYLQVIQGDNFVQISDMNRTQILYLRAPRGNFFDRLGHPIVTNQPSWSLMYSVPSGMKVDHADVEKRLAPYLENFDGRWKRRLATAVQTKKMVRLVENVPASVAFGMREMGLLLPGARMEMEFRRSYENATAVGHLVGYLGEIDDRELADRTWSLRRPGDMIGKMGLERILDDKIRGRDGGTVIEVDAIGRLKRVVQELPYQIGNSVELTVSAPAQKLAVSLLSQTPSGRGAVVALDVKSGAVLTWVSSPAFDPTRSFSEQAADRHAPFFDRVYRGNYPPGSVFKIITALAGLEKKAIDMNETINCVGYVTLEDKSIVDAVKKERRYGCWKVHGRVDFWKAMAESCDTYYYLLGRKIGPVAIHDKARQFALGEPVQTMFPGEISGTIPTPQWKRQQRRGGWSIGDTYNMSIGQGFVTSTPLQMTVMMAAVATKGQLFHPFVVSKITDQQGRTVSTYDKNFWRRISLPAETWDILFRSLRLTVTAGTAIATNIPYLDVFAKTGTAQNPHGEDHAWLGAFAGYPHEEPSVALCVFVENGGGGGSIAAPIARQMLEILLPPKSK